MIVRKTTIGWVTQTFSVATGTCLFQDIFLSDDEPEWDNAQGDPIGEDTLKKLFSGKLPSMPILLKNPGEAGMISP